MVLVVAEKMNKRLLCFVASVVNISACNWPADESYRKPFVSAVAEQRNGPSEEELSRQTQVVILGTGTPLPDPHRAGPSIAVIHKGEAYLFDVGAGAVQNATLARYRYDIPSLYPTQICCVFLTHLHNDHTQDLSELSTAMWWRRQRRLRVWGPSGLTKIASGVNQMMLPDVSFRLSGNLPVHDPDGYKMEPIEMVPGVVFAKDDISIEAFSVSHGGPSFGFRIVTNDITIVISGDTAVSKVLREKARNVDILIHEVISDSGLLQTPESFQAYHRGSHTLASELGRLAAESEPGLLVLYHALLYGVSESVLLDEVTAEFKGKIVVANDLDVF